MTLKTRAGWTLRVVMDKADKIPENTEFIWNIAMTNISREKDGCT